MINNMRKGLPLPLAFGEGLETDSWQPRVLGLLPLSPSPHKTYISYKSTYRVRSVLSQVRVVCNWDLSTRTSTHLRWLWGDFILVSIPVGAELENSYKCYSSSLRGCSQAHSPDPV